MSQKMSTSIDPYRFHVHAGKGRGLLMRKEVEPGEVILVSSPIVRVTAPPGSSDLQERLVNELRTIKDTISQADR